MDKQSEQSLVNDAKGLAKWFSVRITIKILGHTIWEYQYPPQKTS